MPRSSKFPDLKIPKTNILDYLFPQDQEPSDTALWIDARDPSHSLSPKQCLRLVRRLGFGLHRLGIEEGDVALILTPNHIYVPVAYLGMVGYGAIFSGMNPIYTVGGWSSSTLELESLVIDTTQNWHIRSRLPRQS